MCQPFIIDTPFTSNREYQVHNPLLLLSPPPPQITNLIHVPLVLSAPLAGVTGTKEPTPPSGQVWY